MIFRILIDVENAAFSGDPRDEIARILDDLTCRLQAEPGFAIGEELRNGIPLRDINGNTVGRAQLLNSTIRQEGR
jgi:hypothetical protein